MRKQLYTVAIDSTSAVALLTGAEADALQAAGYTVTEADDGAQTADFEKRIGLLLGRMGDGEVERGYSLLDEIPRGRR